MRRASPAQHGGSRRSRASRQFAQTVRDDVQAWSAVIRAANIKPGMNGRDPRVSEERFEGVNGRTSPTPPLVLRRCRARARARPTGHRGVRRVGFSHFRNYGSTIATPNLDRSPRAACASWNFTPPRCACPPRVHAHWAQPPRGGTCARFQLRHRLPNMRGAIPRAPPLCSTSVACRRLTQCTTVGKWHSAPMHETGPAGPFQQLTAWRGFDRSASWRTRPTSFARPGGRPTTSTTCQRRRDAGYHVTEDLGRPRRYSLATTMSMTRTGCSHLCCFGARHLAAQAPQAYIWTNIAAPSTKLGRGARALVRARRNWASCRRTALPPRNPGVKAGKR